MLILWVVRGWNGKKWFKITKYLSVALHISGTIHQIVIYGTLAWNNNIFRCFFHFFKILILWFDRRVKGQKTVQNDKKFCLLFSISQEAYIMWSVSQEPHIMWLSFMVHMCKMIIPACIFFNFSKFWYYVSSGGRLWGGGERAKNSQKGQENFVCRTLYFRDHIPYDLNL